MNLTEVILNDGKVIHREVDIPLQAFEMPDGTYPIVSKTPLSLTVTNKGNKELELIGKADVTVLIPCGRCLKDVSVDLHLDIERELDMKLTEEARTEALDESDFIHGYNLEVDKLVYGEALLIWPMKVLCKEDCKGLCRVCGQDLNLKTCDCDRTDLDPRMAKIRDIFTNFKEV
ncbi:MAG: DUF177 domain-containing protein [Lachnospiraceae bacterium]|nr:DUF177 domain-containing protein [Lachnospiraceae bacterium]